MHTLIRKYTNTNDAFVWNFWFQSQVIVKTLIYIQENTQELNALDDVSHTNKHDFVFVWEHVYRGANTPTTQYTSHKHIKCVLQADSSVAPSARGSFVFKIRQCAHLFQFKITDYVNHSCSLSLFAAWNRNTTSVHVKGWHQADAVFHATLAKRTKPPELWTQSQQSGVQWQHFNITILWKLTCW